MSYGPPIAADGVLWVPIIRDGHKTRVHQGQYCRWIKYVIIRTESPLIIIDISRSDDGEDYLYVIDSANGYHTGIPVSEAYIVYTGDDIK